MALFKRAVDVVRANLNELIAGAEDPEKMINLYLGDAREHLVEAKQAVHACLTAEKTLQAQWNENEKEVGIWGRRAELAVTKGNDELAKEALTEKKKFEIRMESLREPLANSKKQSESAISMVQSLEDRIT